MSTFVLCVGCGEPLYGFSPCRWCTCERCGIDMLNEICPLCNSRNSCVYDPNPNSFDCPPDSYHPPHLTYETYSGATCGNDSYFGYDCPPRFPFNYKPEPGYIQNFNSYPHDSSSFPQQYPCCEDRGVTHEPYQCQPKNHDSYHEQNSCCEPQQYTVNHPIFNAHKDYLDSQNKLTITLTKQEAKRIEEEQVTKAQNWKLLVCYDDDDDEESSNSLKDNIISELPPCAAIILNEPVDSLSMGDEHLDTVLATESDEFIKSCVENLVPNPSESEGGSECDMPAGFTTFSNVLFDADYNFDSCNDQSFSDEDFSKKIYSNPLFDEEIIPIKIDPHSFNVESDLIGSKHNHDSSIIISSKSDSLFDEFAGELTILKSTPPRIDETDCHPEKETRFTKRLLYDNSSPRPQEEFVYDNSHAAIEFFSPSPISEEFVYDNSHAAIESFSLSHISVEDSDSRMEKIDLSFNLDDPMPPSIEDDDHDSEMDILILEELLDNYSLSLPKNESYHFDIPSPYLPPAKPPDGEKINKKRTKSEKTGPNQEKTGSVEKPGDVKSQSQSRKQKREEIQTQGTNIGKA
nr:pre-mRNA splicing Prp18-interacting factor [Tanacetum cinerariifolium]